MQLKSSKRKQLSNRPWLQWSDASVNVQPAPRLAATGAAQHDETKNKTPAGMLQQKNPATINKATAQKKTEEEYKVRQSSRWEGKGGGKELNQKKASGIYGCETVTRALPTPIRSAQVLFTSWKRGANFLTDCSSVHWTIGQCTRSLLDWVPLFCLTGNGFNRLLNQSETI